MCCFSATGNSARSVLAEAILNKHGAGTFNALSATTPAVSMLSVVKIVKATRPWYERDARGALRTE